MKKDYVTQDDVYFANWKAKMKKKLFIIQAIVVLVVVAIFYIARVNAGLEGPAILLAIALCAFVSLCAVSTSVVIACGATPVLTLSMAIATVLVVVAAGDLSGTSDPKAFVGCIIMAFASVVLVFHANETIDDASGARFGRVAMPRRIRRWIEFTTIGQFICTMIPITIIAWR